MTKLTPVTQADLPPIPPVKAVTRFSLFQRIEHLVLLLSFTTLGATGLPQKFADAPLSQFVIGCLAASNRSASCIAVRPLS